MRRLSALLSLCALVACQAVIWRSPPDDGTGGSTSTAPSQGGSSMPPPAPPEPLEMQCPAYPVDPCPASPAPDLLIDATADDLTIVAIRYDAVLATRPPTAGSPIVAMRVVADDQDGLQVSVSDVVGTSLDARPVDVMPNRDEEGKLVLQALLCDGPSCQIHQGAPGAPLAPSLAATSLVEQAAGLGRWVEPDQAHLCIYGDGIACHDGTGWSAKVAAGSGGRLLGTHRSGEFTWFVGEGGRAIVIGPDGAAVERDVATASALRAVVGTHVGEAVIVGDDGTMIITNASDQVAHCDVGAHDFIGVDLWEGWGPKIRAVSASAELFRPTAPQIDDWCVEQVPVTPPLLFTDYPCGLADHLWFGDVSGVHGSVFCPIG